MTVSTIIGSYRINNMYLLISSNLCIKSFYFTCLAMYAIKDEEMFTKNHHIGMNV